TRQSAQGCSVRTVEQGRRGLVTRIEKLYGLQGHARFQSPDTIVVNEELVQADKIYINVGGRASIPEMPGIDAVPFLTNSSMMKVDFLPEHLVIVGGSYVGLE